MDIYMLILANPDGYVFTHTNVGHQIFMFYYKKYEEEKDLPMVRGHVGKTLILTEAV